MMAGVPVIGLATTEMPVTIRNGYSGYVSTDVDFLVAKMHELLNDPELAVTLSVGAREAALQKFDIKRFTTDWLRLLHAVVRNETIAPEDNKYSPEQIEIK